MIALSVCGGFVYGYAVIREKKEADLVREAYYLSRFVR